MNEETHADDRAEHETERKAEYAALVPQQSFLRNAPAVEE